MKKIIIPFICALLVLKTAYAVADGSAVAEQHSPLQTAEAAAMQDEGAAGMDENRALLMAMEQYRFQHENQQRIQNMIQQARQQGVPVAPLMNKVHEGIAKKVDEERIVQAVDRIMNRYEFAHGQVTDLTPNRDRAQTLGNILAEAYTANLAPRDGEKIMQQLQTRTGQSSRDQDFELARETILSARDMARLGVASRTVADLMVNALQHDYQAENMRTLHNSFVTRAWYAYPENIARAYSAQINQGVGAGDLNAGMGGTQGIGNGPSSFGGSFDDPGGGLGGGSGSGGGGLGGGFGRGGGGH